MKSVPPPSPFVSVQGRLIQVGWIEKHKGIYEALDVLQRVRQTVPAATLMLPSHFEGLPNAVLEAMAVGVPVVATRVGALPEILNENCGFLFEIGDTKGMADAVLKLLQDRALRSHTARAARTRVLRDYDIELVWKQFANALDSARKATARGDA